jgi:hypothetical protein
MSYPTGLPIVRASSTQRLSGLAPVRARNNLLKVRRLYSAEKMVFNIVHELSDAQRLTLETAYQAFKLSNLTLTWPEDGTTYTVRFATAPLHVLQTGYWESTVQMLEV